MDLGVRDIQHLNYSIILTVQWASHVRVGREGRELIIIEELLYT
jgi:hypothetical protein